MARYDLITIGGGTAGLVTAVGANALGLRTAVVEREALGGDCLWTGCVPSKALIASARLAYQMRHADRLGLVGAAPAHVFARVMERVRRARAAVAEHDDPERFARLGIDVLLGAAEVAAPNRVRVDGRSLETKRIVVATGSRPTAPQVPGLDAAGYVTHLDAFEQDALPGRIAVLGGGPIGLEFAQVYRRLGADVTVFEVLPHLLPREDEDAAAAVADALRGEGVAIHLGARVTEVRPGVGGGKCLVVDAPDGVTTLEVDQLFVATGRRPNGEGLGLEGIGVAVRDGAVGVDATLRTTVPSVWAAGDVTGGLQFTHVADYHAKLVLRNMIVPIRARADYRRIPWVTYTDPEVARVGLTEAEARARYRRVRVFRYPLAQLDRAIVDGRAEGFVKLVARTNGRLVGATIVGHGAGELLAPLVLAMRHRIPVAKLSQIVWAYPTMAEGIKRAADLSYRDALAGRKGRWIRRVVRWLT